MSAFPGQLTTLRYSGPGFVWHIKPYMTQVFFVVKTRALTIFSVTVH